MRHATPAIKRILVLTAGALLVACVSRGVEVREYVLTSMASSDVGAPPAARELEIGVGPVTLPAYLRRNQIVTRVGENELRVSDTHRWAEDLDRGLARVVAENLSVQVPAKQVAAFPWRERNRGDYRVWIDVERFEQVPDGSVSLEARWALLRASDAAPVDEGRTIIREEKTGSEPVDTVGAMSRALARLSQQIAASIRANAGLAAS